MLKTNFKNYKNCNYLTLRHLCDGWIVLFFFVKCITFDGFKLDLIGSFLANANFLLHLCNL